MELKTIVVTLCLVALAIHSTEGGIIKCCVKTRKTIPKPVLMKVHSWYLQDSTGPCDIDALVSDRTFRAEGYIVFLINDLLSAGFAPSKNSATEASGRTTEG
nr:C-C motif chemokine 27a isoform X2 [Syngnathus scovelli]